MDEDANYACRFASGCYLSNYYWVLLRSDAVNGNHSDCGTAFLDNFLLHFASHDFDYFFPLMGLDPLLFPVVSLKLKNKHKLV